MKVPWYCGRKAAWEEGRTFEVNSYAGREGSVGEIEPCCAQCCGPLAEGSPGKVPTVWRGACTQRN